MKSKSSKEVTAIRRFLFGRDGLSVQHASWRASDEWNRFFATGKFSWLQAHGASPIIALQKDTDPDENWADVPATFSEGLKTGKRIGFIGLVAGSDYFGSKFYLLVVEKFDFGVQKQMKVFKRYPKWDQYSEEMAELFETDIRGRLNEFAVDEWVVVTNHTGSAAIEMLSFHPIVSVIVWVNPDDSAIKEYRTLVKRADAYNKDRQTPSPYSVRPGSNPAFTR